MKALTDSVVLDIWQRGQGRNPVERALLLVAAALPTLEERDCVDLSIGERDAAILGLRQATFGKKLPGRVNCPQCGESLEFELDAGRLRADLPSSTEREFALGDDLRFRLPTSRDLVAIAGEGNAKSASRELLKRCFLGAAETREWPDALLDEAETRITELKPALDIELHFDCAGCGHAWADRLEICSYFWEEIEHHAQFLLDEVHLLASRYGWNERDILGMSPMRRGAYLERCDA